MMDTRAIQRAQNKLELREIVLHTSSLTRTEGLDPLLFPPSVRQHSEVKVFADTVSFVDAEENTIRVLRAYVQLSVSGFRKESEIGNDCPLFAIQGVYRVDYLKKKKMTEIEIDAFTKINSVHNVWPFWRQHVYEVVSKAALPQITIPLFRAIPGAPKAKRSSRHPIDRKSV